MKRWRSLLVLVTAALVLIVAHRALQSKAVAEESPAGDAEWIWARMHGVAGAPTAFFAVKDFTLDFEVATAELRLLGDEEYLVSLNGRAVGAGSYPVSANGGSAEMVAYPVGGLLRHRNRLVVELRSTRGAGGMLARLEVLGKAGERRSVTSDGSWRIARRFDDSLPHPGGTDAVEEPLVWGAQPTGRWGAPTTVVETLTLRGLQNGRPRPLVPAVRQGRHGSPWRVAPPHGMRPLGPWARLDFGRVRTGYVQLRFADSEESRGFVYYDLRRPPEGLAGRGETVIRVAGRDRWTASRPASFRFLTLVGMPEVVGAGVVPVVPEKVAGLLERAPRPSLFGVEREETLVSPVEDEVRSKLQGVPGLARRKEG